MCAVIDLDGGLVGLALAYSVSLTGMFQYCIRQSTEVESLVLYSHHAVCVCHIFFQFPSDDIN